LESGCLVLIWGIQMDLDPIAIGFGAVYMVAGVATVGYLFYGLEDLRLSDYFMAVLIWAFWPFAWLWLFGDMVYHRIRERLRI
jgi:hypothetical protein